jgi:hypothetical protein
MRAKDSAATTAGYSVDGGGSNKDDSKGHSGENGEHGSNSGGGTSHLCLIFFFFGRAHDTVMRFLFLLNT